MATATAKAPVASKYRDDLPKTGEWVFWHPLGQESADPAPAMILSNVNAMRVALLEIHLPSGIMIKDSVHHISKSKTAPKKLLTSHGCWSWEHPNRPETHKR